MIKIININISKDVRRSSLFVNSKGFSLIELLVVIVILAVIGSMVSVGFTASQKKGRDANRKSDLSQFRTALESYANRTNGLYPVHAAAVAADTICGEMGLTITCPVDPKNGTSPYGYRYMSDAAGTKYVLYEYLEATTNYFALCSAGTTLTQASAPTAASCP